MSGAAGNVTVAARHGRWIAAQCMARPDLVDQVEQAIRDPYGRRDVRPLCSWQDWHRGMQLLERVLRRGNGTFSAEDYRQAAELLRAQGHRFAGPLATMGTYSEQVAAYRESWERRYATRARMAGEQAAAQMMAEGRLRGHDGAAWPGVDGARYIMAMHGTPGHGGWRYAVVVRNSAQGIEVVPFQGERPASAWMLSRMRSTGGPVRTSRNGPACRVALEEEVIAWLIHAAHDGQPWDQLGKVVWTSHLRAEAFRAAESAGRHATPADPADLIAWRVHGRYSHWLLFAPGWAVADEIGWPDARYAQAYFRRLAMTPVSEAQALRAAQALARADAEAAETAGATTAAVVTAAKPGERPALHRVPSGRPRTPDPLVRGAQRPIWLRGIQPPPGQARQPGPEPRRAG